MTGHNARRDGPEPAASISSLSSLSTTTAYDGNLQVSPRMRPAVDAEELLAEIERWLDAGDLISLSALSRREVTLEDAVEHALVVNGKVRRLLDSAFVGVA